MYLIICVCIFIQWALDIYIYIDVTVCDLWLLTFDFFFSTEEKEGLFASESGLRSKDLFSVSYIHVS